MKIVKASTIALLCLYSLSSNAAWVSKHGMTSTQFQAQIDSYSAKGFRLTAVSGYPAGGVANYAAIWNDNPGPARVSRHGMTSSQLTSQNTNYSKLGYSQVRVNGYTVNGTPYFAAIWERKSTTAAYVGKHDMRSVDFIKLNELYVASGYRVINISGYVKNDVDYYAANWLKVPPPKGIVTPAVVGGTQVVRLNMTDADYQSNFDLYVGQGYRLLHTSGYDMIGQTRFAAIWEKTSSPEWRAQHNIAITSYPTAFNDQRYEGFELKSVSGYTRGNQPHFATVWQSAAFNNGERASINNGAAAFMAKYDVPALSIAITKNEKLVYAKAFGQADRANGEQATTSHRFRIASVTKPITSTAVFKLVEQGKLALNSTIFGAGGILGQNYGTLPYGPNVELITVGDLLQHTSGGWPNDQTDPTFTQMWLSKPQLISYALDNYDVATPGTLYQYSNFGYFLLGRVIEQVTGQTYGDYVRNNILAAAGSPDMALARNTLAERQLNEVVYYDDYYSPYDLNIANMDAQGGWIASPVELVRFLTRVDGKAGKPDILQPATIDAMLNSPSAASNYYYSNGWAVYQDLLQDNRWHDGLVAGTRTEMAIMSNGYSFAILSNRRDPYNDAAYFYEMEKVVGDFLNSATDWPADDYFITP